MSSTIIRTVSLRVVSLIAMVPDSECEHADLDRALVLSGGGERSARNDGRSERRVPNPVQHRLSPSECVSARPGAAHRPGSKIEANPRAECRIVGQTSRLR